MIKTSGVHILHPPNSCTPQGAHFTLNALSAPYMEQISTLGQLRVICTPNVPLFLSMHHDEAVQPPGFDETGAHVQLPAFPSQEGRRKCLRQPGQPITSSPEHDAAAARDRQAHCHSMHDPPQSDEDPVSRDAKLAA